MKRIVIVAATVVASLALLAPTASAVQCRCQVTQAPAGCVYSADAVTC